MPPLATETADAIGEVVVAVATIVAVVLMLFTIPVVMRRARGRAGLTPALVILTGAAAITFVAYLAFLVRCAEAGCRFSSDDTVAGLEPWWRNNSAWQWGGQLALAGVGLMLASIALALAARERRGTGRAVTLARVAVFLWAVIVFAIPAVWEIFVI